MPRARSPRPCARCARRNPPPISTIPLITTRKLELAQTEADLARRQPLLADQAIAAEELRHAHDAVELARAALGQALRQSTAAHALVDGTPVSENPAVLGAKDAYRDAWIAARRNAVVAPVTGYVAERSVQLGQHIQAGQALMTVIPLNSLWVDANFKEVQLRHLRIGQPAAVRSDLYGGDFDIPWPCAGHVGGHRRRVLAAAARKMPRATGSRWCSACRCASGSTTRISNEHPLRVGLSATVTVDTTHREGAVLAPDVAVPSADTQVYTPDLDKANAEADAVIRRNLGADR